MSDLGPFSASLSGQQCVASKYPIPNKQQQQQRTAPKIMKENKHTLLILQWVKLDSLDNW